MGMTVDMLTKDIMIDMLTKDIRITRISLWLTNMRIPYTSILRTIFVVVSDIGIRKKDRLGI